MKYVVGFIFLISKLVVFNSNAQTNDWDRLKLTDGVSKLTLKVYSAEKNGKNIEKGELVNTTIFKFHPSGYITSRESFSTDYEVETDNFYSGTNRRLTKSGTVGKGSNYEFTFEWDKNGSPTKSIGGYEPCLELGILPEDSSYIEYHYREKTGQIDSIIRYKVGYQQIENSMFSEEIIVVDTKYYLEYDKYDREKKSRFIYDGGNRESIQNFTYDTKNQDWKQQITEGPEGVFSIIEREFEYFPKSALKNPGLPPQFDPLDLRSPDSISREKIFYNSSSFDMYSTKSDEERIYWSVLGMKVGLESYQEDEWELFNRTLDFAVQNYNESEQFAGMARVGDLVTKAAKVHPASEILEIASYYFKYQGHFYDKNYDSALFYMELYQGEMQDYYANEDREYTLPRSVNEEYSTLAVKMAKAQYFTGKKEAASKTISDIYNDITAQGFFPQEIFYLFGVTAIEIESYEMADKILTSVREELVEEGDTESPFYKQVVQSLIQAKKALKD